MQWMCVLTGAGQKALKAYLVNVPFKLCTCAMKDFQTERAKGVICETFSLSNACECCQAQGQKEMKAYLVRLSLYAMDVRLDRCGTESTKGIPCERSL